MSQSTIAILILLVTVILFLTEKLPVSVTAICAMLAMGLFGIIPWTDAFSGMSNSVVWFLIGASILGESFFSTGLADKIGNKLLHLAKNGMSERCLLLFLFVIGVLTSAVFNGAMIVAVLFPIIDAIAHSSNGRITRKQLYLPTAIATVYGSNLTVIGSTSMMLAVSMVAEDGMKICIPFFEPFKIGFPGVLLAFAAYATFAYPLQKQTFLFDEIEITVDESEEAQIYHKSWKCWFVGGITVATIAAVAMGVNYGAAAMIAAMLLIATRCIDIKTAIHGVEWETVFVVVGSLGFAKGIEVSGAGEIIAATVMSISGPLCNSAAGLCIITLFLATLLSNFMSNGATVSIVAPIGMVLAASLGCNPVPFVLAAGVGANISVSTPICVTQITMSLSAGYHFRDLLRIGGLINALTFVVTAIAIKLFYYM